MTPSPTRSEHVENLLDEALEESFPASDPPALTQPNGPRRAPEPAPPA